MTTIEINVLYYVKDASRHPLAVVVSPVLSLASTAVSAAIQIFISTHPRPVTVWTTIEMVIMPAQTLQFVSRVVTALCYRLVFFDTCMPYEWTIFQS